MKILVTGAVGVTISVKRHDIYALVNYDGTNNQPV